MSRIAAVVITSSLASFVASPAFAGTPTAPSASAIPAPSASSVGAPVSDSDGPRSPRTALALSIGTTLAGGAALLAGVETDNDALGWTGAALVFAGPSTGHVYSHHYLTRGLGVRTAGVAIAVLGFSYAVDDCEGCDAQELGLTLIGVGAAAYAAGTIDDVLTAPGAARRYNRAHHAITDLSVAPVVSPHHTGFAVSGRF